MFAFSQGRVVHAQAPETVVADPTGRRPLGETDAVDIWIARWLRVRRKELVARYGCDPRRLYEIWEQGGLRDHYDENVAADATRDDLIQDTRLRDFLRGLRAPA